MKRIFLLLAFVLAGVFYSCEEVPSDQPVLTMPPNNEIWYTSNDGRAVNAFYSDVFGEEIKSNTYINGLGVMEFHGPINIIGNYAFRSRHRLTNISIPNSVKSIGNCAFYDCSDLIEITIPNSVTIIGNSAFAFCSNLKRFKGKFAADKGRCLIIDGILIAYAGASGIEYIIPKNVTTIGESAFVSCDNLTKITIPKGVTSIETGAFAHCRSLINVDIPNSITSIGNRAFEDCSNLVIVNIPNSVTSIGNSVFRYCNGLQNIICTSAVPPQGGTKMFDGICSSAKIYVPIGSSNAYKTAKYWSDYADIIVEKDM